MSESILINMLKQLYPIDILFLTVLLSFSTIFLIYFRIFSNLVAKKCFFNNENKIFHIVKTIGFPLD